MRAKKETEGKTCWKLALREHHRMSITCGQLLQDFLQLQIPPGIPGQYSLFVLPYCIDFTKLHNELRSELLYRYLIKSLSQFETRVQISKFLQCDSCHSILFIFHSESPLNQCQSAQKAGRGQPDCPRCMVVIVHVYKQPGGQHCPGQPMALCRASLSRRKLEKTQTVIPYDLFILEHPHLVDCFFWAHTDWWDSTVIQLCPMMGSR